MKLIRTAACFAIFCSTLQLTTSQALAQRDLKDIPKPDPVAERAAMQIDPLAEVTLYAADPMMRKPIHMNFDEKGRLWIAGSSVYPQIKPGEAANDQILVLEDRNQDGVADHSTVFAEGLLIPTGVVPDHHDGAYVAASTELLHFRDTDGDGKADQKRVVLSGFGTEDTHHLLHTLRWGPDGWLYMNQSIYIHSHVETPYGTKHLDGGGAWRYQPETGKLEVFCRGFVNPWGHIFDPYGQSFMTDGAYFEGINYVFPESVFVTSPGATRWLGGMNPGSPKHCGLEIMSGNHIPEGYWGDFATNDFRSHRVCRFTVKAADTGYTSRQQPELIRTEHVAFRPIDVKMGPDGAIYVADWYNPIIQHGEVDFRDDRRDREHGRVWRISFAGRPLDKLPDVRASTIPQLLDLLESQALWVRQNARMELKHRKADDVLAAVSAWVAAKPQEPRRLLEAMWVQECLDRPNIEVLKSLLQAEDGRLRAAALRTIGRHGEELAPARGWLAQGINDVYPQARLEAVCGLRRLGDAAAIDTALGVLAHPMDQNIDFALWSMLRELQPVWAEAIASGALKLDDADRTAYALRAAGAPAMAKPIVAKIVESDASGETKLKLAEAVISLCNGAELKQLLAWVCDLNHGLTSPRRARVLTELATQQTTRQTSPDEASKLLNEFARQTNVLDDAELRAAVFNAAGIWKVSAMEDLLVAATSGGSEGSAPPTAAIRALAKVGTPSSKAQTLAIIKDTTRPVAWRAEAVAALAEQDLKAAADNAVVLLASRKEAPFGEQAIKSVLERKGGIGALAGSLKAVELHPDAARAAIRVARSQAGTEKIQEELQKLGKLQEAAWKWSAEIASDLAAEVARAGDPARGEAIYRRSELQCIKCHAIGNAGGVVGPNLVSLGGSSQVDYIIESMLNPNAKLKEGFQTKAVLTSDGKVPQGLILSDTEKAIELRLADGSTQKILKDAIDEINEGQSLMPNGLLDGLTKSELVDLIRFLSELGRTPSYVLSTEPIVRAWQTLEYTAEANQKLNRTSIDAVVQEQPGFVWRDVTTRVNGTLALEELAKYQQHRGVPPSTFVRFSFEVARQGVTAVDFGNGVGLTLWVDGRPTPIGQAEKLNLEVGKHQIILAVDRDKVQQLPPVILRLP